MRSCDSETGALDVRRSIVEPRSEAVTVGSVDVTRLSGTVRGVTDSRVMVPVMGAELQIMVS